jgi:YihY family inner membrane protein
MAPDLERMGLSGLGGDRLLTLTIRSIREFFADACTQMAAAIAYRALISIFPLAIVLVSVATLFVDDEQAKEEVVDLITQYIALSPSGEEELARQLDGAIASAGTAGVLASLFLIWAASGMMTAIRKGINTAWSTEATRHFLRGKILDLALLALLGAFALGSLVLTLFEQFVPPLLAPLWEILRPLLPALASFVGFLLAYKLLPAVRTYVRDLWLAALVATVLFELLKVGFAWYLTSLSSSSAIYGSLGAIISFMLFVYIASLILLLGAEFASELPRVRAGIYDAPTESDEGEGGGFLRRLGRELLSGITSPRPDEPFRRRGGPD